MPLLHKHPRYPLTDDYAFWEGNFLGVKVLRRWIAERTTAGRVIWLLAAGLLLAGCGASPHQSGPHPNFPSSGLVRWNNGQAMIERTLAEDLEKIYRRLNRVAGTQTYFEINSSPIPNAFATATPQGQKIILNAGLIDLIGRDDDALAFVIAHELAHARLGHISSEAGRKRRSREVTSNVLGTIVGAFIPFGALMVDTGKEIISADFSRDQERDADSQGLALMRAAGFDPEGAVRFQQRMLQVAKNGALPLFSTHPSGAERVATLKALIEQP